MEIEIRIPSVGESVKEAVLAQWYKQDGDMVHKDEPILVIETDKVTLEVVAEADGILRIRVSEGETVNIGEVAGIIEAGAVSEKPATEAAPQPTAEAPSPEPPESEPLAPEPASPPPPPLDQPL
ncbi:biotin/lipoyl-containing protein, partial [Desulfococcaceae bacterium HSG8]|nr:biotin/lipoyl-containing protein [Desulfococcaceae bacterium HSG8]